MLTKVIKRGFSFNIINSIKNFKSAITAPIKHIKAFGQPSGGKYSTQTNTTEEAFDQVSHEWQAYVVGNAFDLQTYNFLEGAQLANFGTVDNPLVIFTADAPFRYVACTGPQNEEQYESHELMWFMLREGPLQRCGICGQVFKLVRLRNQNSAEMDYYLPNFHELQQQQLGEHDVISLLSIHKMNTHYEFTYHETPSNSRYSLVNPDDHDRMLVDPAYRMQKLTQIEQKSHVLEYAISKVQQENEKNSNYREPFSKVDYENMIDVELAIKKLDRQFRKVLKFESRKFIDPQNHKRREERMLEREKLRWEGAYTLFTGSLTEEEQKYRDYYQTDLQNYQEDERIEETLDRQGLLSEPRYSLNRYDFQEMYVQGAEDDQTSYIEKKVFKFKYRQALDPVEVYERRNKRMIERQASRFESKQSQQIITNYLKDPSKHESAYLKLVQDESVKLYSDYFESDKDENIEILNKVEKIGFAEVFENFQIPKVDRSSYITVAEKPWNPALGWWANTINLWKQIQNVVPTAEQYTTSRFLPSELKPEVKEEVKEKIQNQPKDKLQ